MRTASGRSWLRGGWRRPSRRQAKFSQSRNGAPLPVVLWCPGRETTDGLASAIERGEVLILDSNDPGYEMSALRLACTTYSQFVFLKESVTILKPDEFWAVIDRVQGPAWLSQPPSMYLGVYDSLTFMSRFAGVSADNKLDSIRLESELNRVFRWPVLWPDVRDGTYKRVDFVDGRPEIVIGNDVWEKHKGTARWCEKCQACVNLNGVCEELLADFA
jgi:hypothetical protein